MCIRKMFYLVIDKYTNLTISEVETIISDFINSSNEINE